MTGAIPEKSDCICALIRPEDWDEKEINWTDKLFVADHVNSVFHIPLNFGAKMNWNIALMEVAGAGGLPGKRERACGEGRRYQAVEHHIYYTRGPAAVKGPNGPVLSRN